MSKAHSVLRACALLACSSTVWSATPGPLPPEDDRDLARAILKELVETKTTHDVGTTAAARAIESHLLKAGFASQDVVFIAPPDHPNKGNVVVRYRGKGRARPVLFLGHLDVVEAKAEDWSVDPFKLTEKDGWFLGRGTFDMKDGDAALLESLIRLKHERFKPERDLIVAFTADEEAGGDANGPAFLLKEHRDLVDGALARNPSHAFGWLWSGWMRTVSGESDLAIKHFETSLRLDPRASRKAFHWTGIGMCHFFEARFEEASQILENSFRELPTYPLTGWFLAATYAKIGRVDEARAFAHRQGIVPGGSWLALNRVLGHVAHREMALSGLKLATGEEPAT